MYAMVSSENNHMMELVQYRKRLGPKVDSRDTIDSTGRGVGRYQKDNQNTLYGHLHESFEEAKYLRLAIRQDLEWKDM
jgi:hypothetical protein